MNPLSLVEKNPAHLSKLAEGFRTGTVSIRDYLDKLEDLFAEREPWVKAFLSETDRFGRLRQELAGLESRFPEPSRRPILYGIPVGIKDIFHVEGFATRAGSRLPPTVLQGAEARAVTLLKSSGALVLGKTVTTEFAYFAPGPTRNPHHLDHTPGGSSSGSAAAVASGLCPLALGTQTAGSIIRPASYCGVLGFKPSYGRIPSEGVIPLAPSLDHVGFFTTDVEAATRVAGLLCRDWIEPVHLSRPILGIPEGPYLGKAGEEGLRAFRQACDHLSRAGFQIRSAEMLKNVDEVIEQSKTLLAAEAALVHRGWFNQYSECYREKTSELVRRGQTVSPDLLAACRTGRRRFRNEILKIMEDHQLSALLAPSAVGPAPEGLDSTGDPVMNAPWSHAGLPAMNLPSGMSEEGLPVGLQLIGPWMGDERLLQIAQKIAAVLRP